MKKKTQDTDKLIERFLHGKEFTEDLLQENERLRASLAKLTAKNQEMESKMCNSDLRMLRLKIETLEYELSVQIEENGTLLQQFEILEEDNRHFAERYTEVEKQNSDLISLYVASLQLHSSLDYREVISILKEVMINIVGSEDFVVYLRDPSDGRLRVITHEGTAVDNLLFCDAVDKLTIDTVCTGARHVAELKQGQNKSDSGEPVACIPLHADGKVFGVIAIYSILPQKKGFTKLDFDLFDMLGNHAATALISSQLYALQDYQSKSLDSFIKILRQMPVSPKIDDPRTC